MTRTLQTRNTSKVTFMSATNYCELAAESQDNLYIVRFWQNGDFEISHQYRNVQAFPQSSLVTRLNAAADALASDIRLYMSIRQTDTDAANKLWWTIREKTSQF